MCTLIILRRPAALWPLMVAANRDELRTRASLPPARHWPDRPYVRGGCDLAAGGAWLGVSDDGLFAAVLNRRGTLGPESGKRSRGELVLEALDHADAKDAAAALAAIDPTAYRPFNLVVADATDAWWIRHAGDGPVRAQPIGEGLHMIEAGEFDDPDSARLGLYLPLFGAAAVPDPGRDEWSAWQVLLAERRTLSGDPRDAMTIVTDGAYGTVSSSLVALPRYPTDASILLHAEGPPGAVPFIRVPA